MTKIGAPKSTAEEHHLHGHQRIRLESFRRVREPALERYCQRVLEDVRRIVDRNSSSYHERYLQLWKLLRDRDKTIQIAFDDPRRSQAFNQLTHIDAESLLTEDELNQFSDEAREHIKAIRQ